jgi:HAD superfamily hydrolase (TIGR01549 family)
MPTAVVFDIDGTLVTFNFDVVGAKKALIAELASEGVDVSGVSLSFTIQEIIDYAKKAASGKSKVDFGSLRKKLYSILDESEARSARDASVFPGTRETLLCLRRGRIRLGVLTNSGKGAAHEVLRKGKLLDSFDFILTREDVDTMKPSPDGLLKAVKGFSLPKEQVYYVGDGILDIVAAKRAGLRIISVATGRYSQERLRDEGADYVISSLTELPSLLGLQSIRRPQNP